METRIFLKYLVRGCSNSYLDYLVELIDNYDKTYLIGQKLINGKYPDICRKFICFCQHVVHLL